MKRLMTVLGVVSSFLSVGTLYANPTGAPLVSFPVEPCRVLDTRVSLGQLAPGSALDVYVRGSALQASDGAGRVDCKIPPEAEAVILNIAAISPTGPGNLKINGTGWVHGPMGPYSRINYRTGENDANEVQVSLCNTHIYPASHVPCGGADGRYEDLQILNVSPVASLHLIADVMGYLARAPRGIEGVMWGEVVDKQQALGGEGEVEAYDLLLDNGLHLVCTLPYTSANECDVAIGTSVRASGHAENFFGTQYLYAHGEVGVSP